MFEDSVELGAVKNLGILFPHGSGVIFIPVHGVLVCQHDDVTLSLAFLGTAHSDGKNQFLEVLVKLLVGTMLHSSCSRAPSDSVEVKVNAEIVAGVSEVWDRDTIWTVDDASFVIILGTDEKEQCK